MAIGFVPAYVINIDEPSRMCFSDMDEKTFYLTSWISLLKGLLLAYAPQILLLNLYHSFPAPIAGSSLDHIALQ